MKITILHLSDTHIQGNEDRILKRANEIATTCFSKARLSDTFFIVVTGDIAYSGNSKEYDAIVPFLLEIKKAIEKEGCTLVEILVVPGNHDCVLRPEVKARSIIISDVIRNPDHAKDESVIETCVSAQENYFNFRKQITKATPKLDHPLLTEYEFLINGRVVRFTAINAAWMSRVPEKEGQLVFPANKFRVVISEPAALRFVLLHHPLNWYCSSSFHEFRTLIRTHATAILSGHEHINHAGQITEMNAGTSSYFEANALQPHDNVLEAGYATLYFDLDSNSVLNNIYQTVYELKDSSIRVAEEHDLPLAEANSNIAPSHFLHPEFLKKINDPGGGFIHPDTDYLQIDDLFVYPELKRKMTRGNKKTADEKQYSTPAEEIIYSDIDNLRLIILGEDKAGKSTLIYQALKEFHSRGYTPVLLNADEISSFSASEFSKMLAKCAANQYNNPDHLIREEKKKRIVLVDNLDRLRGGLKMIMKFIQVLENEFGSIILAANSGFEISELVNKEAAETLLSYKIYEITRFGHTLRHMLIRKWCLCGPVGTLQELDKQVHTTENLVNTVVGRHLVPSQPFYLLILLQSSTQHQQSELKNSSFAHYYEYLMTGNLIKSGVKRDQYDELFNYIAHLAWHFRISETHEASISELAKFNSEHSNKVFKVDLQPRLDLLVSAKLIKKRGDFYSFSYPYVFYFFLGRYLAKKLHKPEIKIIVTKWCSELSRRSNAHAIMFLTYHVNDPWVIEQVATVLSKCFETFAPIQFDQDINFVNDLIEDTTKQIIKIEEHDVTDNQLKVRKLRDEQDTLEEEEEELDNYNDKGLFHELNLFIKTAEILGQIVKNYYGSLERPEKKQLIKEVFDAPLRFLRCIFESIHKHPDAFILEVEKIVLLKNPELKALNKQIIIRNAAIQFLGQASTGIILRSSANVSTDKLDIDINELLEDHQVTAYKLLALGAKFISPKNLPFDEIRRLAKELEKNPFAFGILQSFGAMHIHQFHLDFNDRQRLCSLLKIEVEASQLIDYKTRKTKLLKS